MSYKCNNCGATVDNAFVTAEDCPAYDEDGETWLDRHLCEDCAKRAAQRYIKLLHHEDSAAHMIPWEAVFEKVDPEGSSPTLKDLREIIADVEGVHPFTAEDMVLSAVEEGYLNEGEGHRPDTKYQLNSQ